MNPPIFFVLKNPTFSSPCTYDELRDRVFMMVRILRNEK